jgi:hypothetical protein
MFFAAVATTTNDHNAISFGKAKARGKRKATSGPMFKNGKNRHIDISAIDNLLTETDKDTEIRRAWVAIRNRKGDSITSEDSQDLTADDDNSVDYLSDAISGFFRSLCSCECWKGRTPS